MTEEIGSAQGIVESSLELRVVRCGCGHPEAHRNRPCPKPREIVDIDPEQVIVVQQEK